MAPQQGVRSDASHGDISLENSRDIFSRDSNTDRKRLNIKFLEDVVVDSKETTPLTT